MMVGVRLLLLAVMWLSWLMVPASAVAAAAVDRAAGLAELEQRRVLIGRLQTALDDAREWDRDGLSNRIDGLGLGLLENLNRFAASYAAEELAGNGELVALLDWSVGFGLERVQLLEQRIAAERETVAKFEQGPQADIARAFMFDLSLVRLGYLNTLIDQIEIRRSAGLDVEALLQTGIDQVTVVVERLTGQIRLDAMSLAQLRASFREDPTDEGLTQAIGLVGSKQARSLDVLAQILDPAERLGIDVSEQRSLLIRERGQVGVDILERDVFGMLWSEQMSAFRDSLVRNGPNFLFQTILFLGVVATAWLAARLVRRPVFAFLGRERFNFSQLLREVMTSMAGIIVFLVGVVVALSSVGVSLGPLLAGIGVLGIIVGLAVQDSLGNLAAGAMILAYRPYDVDDHVQVSGAEGLVKRMNLLATTIATFDNENLIVPNRKIWGDTITNFTANRVRRLDLKVTFAYSEDPDRVRTVLLDLVQSHERVLRTPAPLVHMGDMEESALTMMVKPWVRTEDYWEVRWDLTRAVKQRFDSEGIEIPFPQRTVTVRTAAAPEPAAAAEVLSAQRSMD